MPKPFPKEFRDDVVAIAMRRDSNTTLRQIATDFGVSESGLAKWVKAAEIEAGTKPGVTAAESSERREAKKRIRLLEQEIEVMRRATAYFSQAQIPKG